METNKLTRGLTSDHAMQQKYVSFFLKQGVDAESKTAKGDDEIRSRYREQNCKCVRHSKRIFRDLEALGTSLYSTSSSTH